MTTLVTPPVVLSITYHAPLAGAEPVAAWIARAQACAALADGFLGSGVDTTSGPDGVRFVASYKFASDTSLDSFVASSSWQEVQSDRPDVLVGVPLESRSSEANTARTAEVITADVPVSRLADYQERRAELDAKAAESPGFVSIDIFEPAAGQTTWTTVLTFDSEDSLNTWRASPERTALVARIRQVAEDEDRVVPTGFGQWFSVNATATAQAPAWKQAMTVLAVLYAMVSLLDMTLSNFIGPGLNIKGDAVVPGLGLPFPVVVFIGNAVGTVLLTWVLMPIVTRLLAWWLDPAATTAQTVRGIGLMVVIYAVEMLFFVWVNRTFSF